MNTRCLRIAAFVAVILLLVGIGAFVVYDTNVPVQEVRVEVDQGPAGDIDFGQDANLDHNPTSHGVIADSKRDAEWYAAIKEYEKKYDALMSEGYKLDDEFKSLLKEAEGTDGAVLEALVPKIKAQIAKDKAWEKRLEALKQQRPVRPIPTHKH